MLTVDVDRRLVGEAHPQPGRHVLGRVPESCVPLAFPWVSWVQLAIVAGDLGWVVANGFRTRLTATSATLEAVVMPGGSVWASPGEELRLTWPELPRELVVTIKQPRLSLHAPQDERAAGTAGVGMLGPTYRPTRIPVGTQIPLDRRLTDRASRTRMAVLFRHLLLDEERPANLYRSAAVALGYNEDVEKGMNLLKQAVDRLIKQLNRERSVGLSGVDALGHFLVFTSGALTPDDLD